MDNQRQVDWIDGKIAGIAIGSLYLLSSITFLCAFKYYFDAEESK